MKPHSLWITFFSSGIHGKTVRLALLLLASTFEGTAILYAGDGEPDSLKSTPMDPPLKSAAKSELHSVEVTHRGAKFELSGATEWLVPVSKMEDREIPLKLRITNCGPSPLRFLLFDTVRVILRDAGGLILQAQGGRDTTKPGQAVTPVLAPGERFELSRRTRLSWAPDNTLRVIGEDGFGGEWYFDGLVPNASYYIMLVYENSREEMQAKEPLWTGQVTTPALKFNLR